MADFNLTKLIIRNLPCVQAVTLNFGSKSLITCASSKVRKTIFQVIKYLLTGNLSRKEEKNHNFPLTEPKIDLKLFGNLENQKLVLEYNANGWFINGQKKANLKKYLQNLWKIINVSSEEDIFAKINPSEIIQKILDEKQSLKIRSDIISTINSVIQPRSINDANLENLAVKYSKQKGKITTCEKELKANTNKLTNLKNSHPKIKVWKTNDQELKKLKSSKNSLLTQIKEKQNYEKITKSCQEKKSRLLSLKKRYEEMNNKEKVTKETPTLSKKVLSKISFFKNKKRKKIPLSSEALSPEQILVKEDISRFEQKVYALQKELNRLTNPLSDLETLQEKLKLTDAEIINREKDHKIINQYQEITNQINNLKREIKIEKDELVEIKLQIDNLEKINLDIVNNFFTSFELNIFDKKHQPVLIIKKDDKRFENLEKFQKEEIAILIHNLIQKNNSVKLPIIIEEITNFEILADNELQVITCQEGPQKEIAINNFNY